MYQLTDNPDIVLRLNDGACIPRGHRFWGEYEEWLKGGNSPLGAIDTREIQARSKRDALLRASDWTQLPDCPLSAIDRQAWASYRAVLRALPSTQGFPDVEWPQLPVLAEGVAAAGGSPTM